jgi:hypothetical protein
MASAAAALAGCSGSDLPETVPVRGVVTFAGKPCPGPGTIRFTPLKIAEGLPHRPGRAAFKQDGAYAATSFQDGDGLVPGVYRVQIECWKVEPAQGVIGISYIAPEFKPPELTVKADQDVVQANFDLPGM